MTMPDASDNAGAWWEADVAERELRPRLTFDADTDVVVIGGGLAGLTVALEAARRGQDVVLLESRRIAWNASGRNGGVVMPGFAADPGEVIERVGFDHARALWQLAQSGLDHVRELIESAPMPGVAPVPGWLQVSRVETGDELIRRLQVLGEDFAVDVEGWQAERVRDALRTRHYFHGVHYPKAFHIHPLNYALGLAALAEKAGARIFEDTPVVSIDPAGVRKRIVTPSARLRASHIVLAGNVHLGSPSERLAQTLTPVWAYAGVTEPLGERLAEAVTYAGAVSDTNEIDRFRVVGRDRLMWSSPQTTWEVAPRRFAGAIQRRIRKIFPQLGRVGIAAMWSGVYGQTVHGMPQVGQWRPGLWIASGFGRQGLNTSAMAGHLIASAIAEGDDRWRLFAPFELVWAGGVAGRLVQQGLFGWQRSRIAVEAAVSRYHEVAQVRVRRRESRMAAAKAAARRAAQAVREGDHALRRPSRESEADRAHRP